MWENIVGRSRPFWNRFYPSFQEAFPEAVGDVDQERFYRAINRVKPSYIRVDADEATYNLHIILRFELEQEILAGTIDLKELPEVWNARFEEYLGIPVPTTRSASFRTCTGRGGGFGYFPTYSLGNIISVQIWEKVLSEIPDLPDQFEQGEFGQLHDWLRTQPVRARPQVHAAGDARARRRRPDRRRPVRPLPEGEARGARRGLAGAGPGQWPVLDELAVEDQEHDRAAEREGEPGKRLLAGRGAVGVDRSHEERDRLTDAEPAIPSTSVCQSFSGSFPGTANRANSPMINPETISERMKPSTIRTCTTRE